MPLKLMYITNKPEVAGIAEKCSVDRIWVDLEKNGKERRQHGLNTVKSDHVITDVSVIRNTIEKAELLVRVNPIYENSRDEIDEVILRGADVVMLPYFETVDEACRFVDFVGGRAKTLLLVETIGAQQALDEIMDQSGADEIHIGLNDLHLQYEMSFMFELLANGTVDDMCSVIRKHGIPYGFGGIAKLDEGLLPARHVIAEHYRLGSTMAILSRSFYDTWIDDDYEEIERSFRFGLQEIREYEQRMERETPEFFKKNHERVIREVNDIVKNRAK